jgi:hypothetical protein
VRAATYEHQFRCAGKNKRQAARNLWRMNAQILLLLVFRVLVRVELEA